jgi:hypothetical protein
MRDANKHKDYSVGRSKYFVLTTTVLNITDTDSSVTLQPPLRYNPKLRPTPRMSDLGCYKIYSNATQKALPQKKKNRSSTSVKHDVKRNLS